MEQAIWNVKQAVRLLGSNIQGCPVPLALVARITAVASQAVELPSTHRALLFPPLMGSTPAAPAAYQVCPTSSCLWVTYLLFFFFFLRWLAISQNNLRNVASLPHSQRLWFLSSLFKCCSVEMLLPNVHPNSALHTLALHFRDVTRLLTYNVTHGLSRPPPVRVLIYTCKDFV